ncbi:MAG: rRNA maturation RNase YbeY [Methylacidiphilales bacterium]|nr:rRNA maturation RNase YbeY [Candidatus Methylacidiphilales bacterium]MDW8349070.1 rRNA maturation RNase YbeY [Verrucomicrobiae bacterium]
MKKTIPHLHIHRHPQSPRLPLRPLRNYWLRSLTLLPHTRTALPPTVSIHLVSLQTITALHKRFLNDPTPTDVITFHHGEIFICPAVAIENAPHYNTSPIEEIALYGLHGLLHLCGFTDTTPSKRRIMHRIQNSIHNQIRELL